jgi:hypothetical protein
LNDLEMVRATRRHGGEVIYTSVGPGSVSLAARSHVRATPLIRRTRYR